MEITIALNTQTPLQHEVQKDRNWLEGELMPLVERGTMALLSRGDGVSVYECLTQLSNLVGYLANQLDTTNLGAIQALAQKVVNQRLPGSEPGRRTGQAALEDLGLVDNLGMVPIAAILGVQRWAEEFKLDGFFKRVGEIRWSKRKSAYKSGLPYGALENLESLQRSLSFEIAVEGRRVSPDWYVGEIILLGVMRKLHPCIDQIIKTLDDTFLGFGQSFFAEKHYRESSTIAGRGLEFLSKLGSHLPLVKKVVDEVYGCRRVEGLKWPELNFPPTPRKCGSRERVWLICSQWRCCTTAKALKILCCRTSSAKPMSISLRRRSKPSSTGMTSLSSISSRRCLTVP